MNINPAIQTVLVNTRVNTCLIEKMCYLNLLWKWIMCTTWLKYSNAIFSRREKTIIELHFLFLRNENLIMLRWLNISFAYVIPYLSTWSNNYIKQIPKKYDMFSIKYRYFGSVPINVLCISQYVHRCLLIYNIIYATCIIENNIYKIGL